WMRAMATPGDRQGQRARTVGHAEMKGGEGTHRQPDHVCTLDAEPVQHGKDVVPRPRLRIALRVLGHLRGRVAPGVVGDAAVTAREVAELRLPAAMVARELVHEDDGRPGPGL